MTSFPKTIKDLLGPGASTRVIAADMAEDGLPLSFGNSNTRGSFYNNSSETSISNKQLEKSVTLLLQEKTKTTESLRGIKPTIFGDLPIISTTLSSNSLSKVEKEETVASRPNLIETLSNTNHDNLETESTFTDNTLSSHPLPSSLSSANEKLFALRLRMNAGRVDNHKEAIREHTRKVDPNAEKRQNRLIEETDAAIEKSSDMASLKRPRNESSQTSSFLTETALDAERHSFKEIEKKKRMTDSYGWNVNSDAAMIHAHEKRLAALPLPPNNSESSSLLQILVPGAALVPSSLDVLAPVGSATIVSSISNSASYDIDPARIDRVVAELEATDARRAKFHRRRTVDTGKETAFVSEQNRGFNKKIAKEMDIYSVEIKQSLERGTG